VPAAPAAPAPATAANATASQTNVAIAAPGGSTQTAAPANTFATLHVSQQSQGASSAPATSDLGSLAVTIAAKSQDGLKQFEIRLDPPELGRVDVRLSVDDAGKAQATLTADRPQTLQLLQADASQLTRSLKDAGINLADSGLNFSLRGQNQQAGGDGGNGASSQRGRALSVRALAGIDAVSQASSLSSTGLSSDGVGVDIRV
jgi:flagellar hook-length control protein FliK